MAMWRNYMEEYITNSEFEIFLEDIVVCYLCVKELWNIGYILSIIAIFGIIQLIILSTVKTPYYWEEDGISIRLFAAFGVQPVICGIACLCFLRTITTLGMKNF